MWKIEVVIEEEERDMEKMSKRNEEIIRTEIENKRNENRGHKQKQMEKNE